MMWTHFIAKVKGCADLDWALELLVSLDHDLDLIADSLLLRHSQR